MFSNSWFEITLLRYVGDPSATVKPGRLITFDLKTIHVGGNTPIQLWFRKTDGSVWGFHSLAAGVNWNISDSASDIVAAWISGANGSRENFVLDNFSIRSH